ncbi:acyl carrier protein [Lichenihabitans sp. Uapishka_5]|uniref:acyl carrier protein n=1 Tax=Lichenihabitans sp. Uapishka_5 TaxID=3037302 RepID=UPI0029E7F9A7|nr:acyl carrier protein [Lichenihabitans sp. Uapishka_5]MDX7954010.1 acyl carrier protein [Lichenihabitans sp. Uapishka_5]
MSCPVETLSDTADLFEAGLTSYGSVRLMLAVEERFDVEFPDALLTRKTFTTLAALAEAVASLVPEKV